MFSVSASCRDILHKLQIASRPEERAGKEICDEQQRFSLWVKNIGALHPKESPLSVEARLQGATDILDHLKGILKYALESANQLPRMTQDQEPSDTEDYTTLKPIEEISEYITRLFRISRLIRKAAISDHFQKALRHKRSEDEWYSQADVRHVGDKFPKVATGEYKFLQQRLGRAITQRRQYIKYVQRHKSHLAGDYSRLEPTGYDDNVTRASSLNPAAPSLTPQMLHGGADLSQIDDIRSETTVARTTDGESESFRVNRLPRLCDLPRTNQNEVECRYCAYVGSFHSEGSWQRHVYSDLRAYVCTFDGCDQGLFRNINEWFNHELNAHRSSFRCILCPNEEHRTAGIYLKHIRQHHPILLENGAESNLLSISRRVPTEFDPTDCPLCNNYTAKFSSGQKITATRFKRHVGNHLEQLCVFALPILPIVDEEEDEEEQEDDHRSILTDGDVTSSEGENQDDQTVQSDQNKHRRAPLHTVEIQQMSSWETPSISATDSHEQWISPSWGRSSYRDALVMPALHALHIPKTLQDTLPLLSSPMPPPVSSPIPSSPNLTSEIDYVPVVLQCGLDGCYAEYTGSHRRGSLARHMRLKHGHDRRKDREDREEEGRLWNLSA